MNCGKLTLINERSKVGRDSVENKEEKVCLLIMFVSPSNEEELLFILPITTQCGREVITIGHF